MAKLLAHNYDVSEGAITWDTKVMKGSLTQVITFEGTGFDASDSTLSLLFSNDGVNYYAVKDNEDSDVVVTLVPTTGSVSGYINHEIFPGEYLRVSFAPESVTAGSINVTLGGRLP